MGLRRGFKTEANGWARDLRLELGIPPAGPMCPRKLCDHLGLPLLDLSKLEADPAHIAFYTKGPGRKEFSAVTLQTQGKRWIVHNDAHDSGRQASNIAHEIAHALLGHPVTALFGADGQRSHNPDHEEEANWLGPALLISEEAALFIVQQSMSVPDAAEFYGTSREVVQMRINVSGARKRAAA
ncbi:ImmA/IrrE family metallo-endopeptidase [Devosia submarina]|uniref:ImmA/IrrE family metallo-endopeptidase n=1 Tax=Devosia submarina TaxID=1173082 RepID=UPI000D34175A|nr:ImmA/IrrE family metallo-endopeptidase [Devosia submarina]